jgi:predicted GNAT family N-acyltransferase
VWLNAQDHAMPFYARYGFVAEGEWFMEGHVAHRRMRRDLAA